MKILEISEYYFELSGILVLSKSRSAAMKAFIQNVFVVFLMGPFLCGTSAAFIYYHPGQFENCIFPFSAACGGTLATGTYLSLKLNENRIKTLIESLQETVDKAPTEIRKLYLAAETRGRRLTNIAIKMMILSFAVICSSCSLFSAFYNIKLGRMDTREWFQFLNMQIPYERYTVPEYFVRQSLCVVMAYYYVISVMSSVTFLMNCHNLFEVEFFRIKLLYVEMDELAQRNPQSNFSEIKNRMVRMVKLHNRLLDLTKSLSKIMSGPIFFQSLCNVGIAAGLLNLVKFDKFDSRSIEALTAVLTTIFWIFLYGYFATRISTMLEQNGHVAYQTQWYNYSIDVQKCVRLMIRRAQVPFQFKGLKMVVCNMEIFAAILRLICTYYLMLNKMNGN